MIALTKDYFKEIIVGLVVLVFVGYIAQVNFLLFHIGVELFSIIIAFSIFVIVINVNRAIDDDYFIFLGLAYGFIAGFDLLHTLAYKGMDIFSIQGANLATELWIASRYLEVLSLLASFLFLKKKINKNHVLLFYFTTTIMLLLSIFQWGIFPDCFITGEGLTTFKIVSEYVIVFLLLIVIALLYYHRSYFDQVMYRYLILSVLATITAELFFTLYISVFGISNIAGHLFKLLSFYFIYKAVIKQSLQRPYEALFASTMEAKEELAFKNRELEQVVYSISHDLRSPVVNIKGFSQELKVSIKNLKELVEQSSIEEEIETELNKLLEEDVEEELHYILSSTKNIDNLLKGLLKISRIDRYELNLEEIDVNEMIAELRANYQYQLQQQDINLIVQELPNCKGDRVQINQVFSNLIENAIKYSSTEAESEIIIEGWKEEERVVYTVADNGIGIAPADQDEIFVIFNRLGNQDDAGEGLGLSLVKKIIDRHHGDIWVESELGEGSKFFIALPK
ncbi:MAG: MASE3 domain-containing protein [Bacillota bacterium]